MVVLPLVPVTPTRCSSRLGWEKKFPAMSGVAFLESFTLTAVMPLPRISLRASGF